MSPEDVQAWAGRRVLVLTPTPTHPIDFGNRKRVHEVCRTLQGFGAEIHMLHYASETDWRVGYPIEQLKQMALSWDSYATIFPTRSIHPPPQKGMDHDVDEWWDPAIGQTLSWMFSHHSFDAFIVNYTWLSKALEFAPRHTMRILDTHDRFSGRREMLEAHGIAAQFFHIEADSERTALDRADVVWAIKEQEAEYFARLTRSRIVVVPHADRRRQIMRRRPDGEGLRFGIIGARNSINQTNILNFARVATPIFSRWLAPLTVVVVGSVCELLPADLGPHFELLGRVDDLDEVYGNIDVALIPMSFSTGLKIKVAEALALGLPVVSHAHAFEGFKGRHPWQVLPDFEQIARTCVDLAYEPVGLDQLAAASHRSQSALESAVYAGFGKTGALLASFRPRLLILASAESVEDEDRLAYMWLASSLPFLAAAAHVTLLVRDDDVRAAARVAPALDELGVHVVHYPTVHSPTAERADQISDIVDLARRSVLTFVIDEVLAGMAALPLDEMRLCFVSDVFGFGIKPDDGRAYRAAIAGCGGVVVICSDRITPDHLRIACHAAAPSSSTTFGIVPLFSEKYLAGLDRVPERSHQLRNLVIFAPDPSHQAIVSGLERLLTSLDAEYSIIIVCRHPLHERERTPAEFLQDWRRGLRIDLVVDLAPGVPYTAALREMARRRGALFVDQPTFSSVETYMADGGCGQIVQQILQTLNAASNGGGLIRPDAAEYENEAGWAWLWRFISDLTVEAKSP